MTFGKKYSYIYVLLTDVHVYYADLDATTCLLVLGYVYKLHYHIIHGSNVLSCVKMPQLLLLEIVLLD